MWEFSCDIECAHCGNEETEHFAFNPNEADQCGMSSNYQELICWECDETYWAKAYVSFDVSVSDNRKTKPKKQSTPRGEK